MTEKARTEAMQMQPRSVTDIVDGSFRLYRNNFVTFLGIAAVFGVPVMMVQSLLSFQYGGEFSGELLSLSRSFDPTRDPSPALLRSGLGLISGTLLLSLLQVLVVLPLLYGALSYAAAHSMRGEPASIATALGALRSRMGALLGFSVLANGLGFLLIAGFIGLLVALGALALGAGPSSSGSVLARVLGTLALGFLAIVALVVVFLAIVPRLIFSYCVIMVEGLGPLAALRRSWSLVRGLFWRTLGVYLLLSVLAGMLAGIPTTILNQVIVLATGGPLNFDALATRQALQVLVSTLFSMLTQPLTLAGLTLAYYDLRVRKEAYDLELQLDAQSYVRPGT
jgi:hypothetical protein